jgi:hypothetical protein
MCNATVDIELNALALAQGVTDYAPIVEDYSKRLVE